MPIPRTMFATPSLAGGLLPAPAATPPCRLMQVATRRLAEAAATPVWR